MAIAALFAAASVHAAPASDASVRQLMEITHTRAMVDGMLADVDVMLRRGALAGYAQKAGGRPLTPEAQAGIDRMVARVADLLRSEMRWSDLEPEYVKVYAETFEQDEVDGMIAFYRTPVGQALIAKMPLVLQKSMALGQARMQSLMPKIMAMMAEEMKQLP